MEIFDQKRTCLDKRGCMVAVTQDISLVCGILLCFQYEIE